MRKYYFLALLAAGLFMFSSCTDEEEWPSIEQINEYMSSGEWEMTAAEVKQSVSYKMLAKISADTTFNALEEMTPCEIDFFYSFLNNTIGYNGGDSYCGPDLSVLPECTYELLENGRKLKLSGENMFGLSTVLDYFNAEELVLDIEKVSPSVLVLKQVYPMNEFLEQFADAFDLQDIIDLGITIDAKMEIIYRFNKK